jgi:tetratricopeptide (TPR) repeat protein
LEDQVDHPTLRGMWGWERPMISIWDGDYADAIEASAKWRNARETSGDVASVLWGRWSEALARMASGEYERALAILLDVVLEGDRVGERLVYTRALNTIGWIYVELQDLERAVEWNRRSFDEAVASGFPDPEIEANAALNLGDAYLAAGRLDEAAEQYAWVERIYRNPRPEDRFALFRYSQHMLASFGTLWLERGDTVKARRYADECLELAEASGAKKNVVKAKRLRGEIARREGRLEDAEREVAEALALARAIGNPGQLWKTWDALGGVRAAMGKSDEAAAAWREAVAVIDRVASSLQDANLRETFLASRHVSEIRAKV